jgi:hypothetical protein
LVIGILVLGGVEAVGILSRENIENGYDHIFTCDDMLVYQYQNACGDMLVYQYQNARGYVLQDTLYDSLYKNILGRDYPIGETIWQYIISTSYDNSPKAISPIQDINSDGIDDVIVCSEDDYVRCFDGGAIGTGVVLWEHEIYAGDIYSQKGLDIIEDVDGDGYDDVVVGATGGARLIRCISGDSGTTIWTHDTHEYGGGGWVYQVDSNYDYNGDGTIDVLASTGDDSSDTGPKRVYCLDGEDGTSIWERPLGGPGFSVIGVEDFTGDGQADVLAGCSNEGETIGYAKGINGDTGVQVWSYTTPGSSVWALEQVDDVSGDGIKDVIIGDFLGYIYGLDATDGGQEYSNSIAPAIITRFAKLTDVNSDGHPDIVPAHSTSHVTQVIDGQTGSFIWTHAVADQPWNVARTSDISGDGIDDVLVGTLYNSNYCYFLNGVDGSELESVTYGEAVDAIMAIPDVVGDGSMEMVAGGRNGKVTCISGGLDSSTNEPPNAPTIDGPITGVVDVSYEFTFVSTDLDNDVIYYYIDWDDGTYANWIGPYNSGEIVTEYHSWDTADSYSITAKAKDENELESEWSDPYIITIVENDQPGTPIIDGPSSGNVGTKYYYNFTAIDPDGDQIKYIIEWGDNTTDTTDFYDSEITVTVSHTWSEKGMYIIKAKAVDEYDAESDWGTLEVNMPLGKISAVTVPYQFLQQHQNMFPMLRYILGL